MNTKWNLLAVLIVALTVALLWISGCAPKAETAVAPMHQMPSGEMMPGMNMGGSAATAPSAPAAAPSPKAAQRPSEATKTPTEGSAKPAAKAQTVAAVYTCPMHPEVTSDKPGKCPKCGMNLVKRQ